MRPISILVAAGVALACASEAKDRRTPESALARLAPCVDRGDARCVYAELDRSSRWSIQTIHKTLAEMRALVEASYPAARRGAPVYGDWDGAAAAADDAGTFAAFCERRGCVAEIASRFGPAAAATPLAADRVRVATARGGSFLMAAADGEWGLATWAEELSAEKIRLADRLVQVRIDARAFDEQRRATGGAR
jgi:hypothetical protein